MTQCLISYGRFCRIIERQDKVHAGLKTMEAPEERVQ